MKNYNQPQPKNWSGRVSGEGLYLHENIVISKLDIPLDKKADKDFALLGYCCDAGVARNQGRAGAAKGPEAIRSQLGRMPSHLPGSVVIRDVGDINCREGQMEVAQQDLQLGVSRLLNHKIFPLVLGGGHDMAYGHYKGFQEYHGSKVRTGIINFDAHFDLRDDGKGANSGTPFYQIAKEAKQENRPFDYLCLGIRPDANDAHLYATAKGLGVHYMEREDFAMHELTSIQMVLLTFIERVDQIYVTIDLDGFSSAYAPGVSAPSPMGFAPDIVWESLKIIIDSNKLVSVDIAELNPKYDLDQRTARLAASLIHGLIHRMALL